MLRKIKDLRLSPQQKWKMVEEVLKGNEASAVAEKNKIDESLLTKWVDKATTAAFRELKWTQEDWERPSIRQIQLSQTYNFPTQLLRNVETIAAFFSAFTYGRNDVIYYYTAGVPFVLCNDIDKPRMEYMKKIYPRNWQWVVGDAYKVAKDLGKKKKRFDLVSCDHYTGEALKVLENYDLFRRLANKYFLFQATADVVGEKLNSLGIDLTTESFELDKAHSFDSSIRSVSIYKRSNHLGGSYSVVLHYVD